MEEKYLRYHRIKSQIARKFLKNKIIKSAESKMMDVEGLLDDHADGFRDGVRNFLNDILEIIDKDEKAQK